MRLDIVQTPYITSIQGAPVRAWAGTDHHGTPVLAFVRSLAVDETEDQGPFKEELMEGLAVEDLKISMGAAAAGVVSLPLDELLERFQDRSICAVCGCTDEDCHGCIERTGHPCRWLVPGLCSACAPAEGVVL